jgi:hypothetical protein
MIAVAMIGIEITMQPATPGRDRAVVDAGGG